MQVTIANKTAVDAFLRSIYVHDVDSDRRRVFQADPGILWLLNTHGCQLRVILALFADPLTYKPFTGACGCNNCAFRILLSPNDIPANFVDTRDDASQNIPPPELRLKGKTAPVRRGMKNDPNLLMSFKLRDAFDTALQRRIAEKDAQYRRLFFNFSVTRTVRYQDTVCRARELAAEFLVREMEKLDTTVKADANLDLIVSVEKKLYKHREFLYRLCGAQERGVGIDLFFPPHVIDLLSIAAGTDRMQEQSDLQRSLNQKAKFEFTTSLISPFLSSIFTLITDEIEDAKNQSDTARLTDQSTLGRKRPRYYDPNDPEEIERQRVANEASRAKKLETLSFSAALAAEKATMSTILMRFKSESSKLASLGLRKDLLVVGGGRPSRTAHVGGEDKIQPSIRTSEVNGATASTPPNNTDSQIISQSTSSNPSGEAPNVPSDMGPPPTKRGGRGRGTARRGKGSRVRGGRIDSKHGN